MEDLELTISLSNGVDYGGGSDIGATGALSGLDSLVTGYGLFENKEKYDVDFLIMGSANYSSEKAASTCNKTDCSC